MRVDVSQYVKDIRKSRKLRHRAVAFLTAMSMAVSMAVFWQLRGVGTAMESAQDTKTCSLQEHTHTDECYETVLVCKQDTKNAAEDTDSSVQDADSSAQSTESAAENTDSAPDRPAHGHVHTDECYEKRLICELEEHKHSAECTPDETADVETEKVWEKTLPEKLTEDVRENIALVAQSQLGYSESKTNFHFSDDGETKYGYTRYGQWYGSPYSEWNSLFTYFCMYYAGVDRQTVPYGSGIAAWTAELEKKELLVDIKNAKLRKGDIIIMDTDLDGKPDRSAVVSEITEKDGKTTLETIEGNVEGKVANSSYEFGDKHILSCVDLGDVSEDVFFEQASASGVKVTAKAEKGTFPDKTTMTVKDISKSEAVKTAEAALGKDRKVEEAVAVDITFKDANGKEIEPADSKNVQVQIKLPDKIRFDEGEYSLLHVIDKNNVKEVKDANVTANGAEFETESFSIFVLTRDKGYVEPGQLVMLGEKGKGNNSEDKPYMIYIGETISVRYIGDNKDTGKFTVFNNNDYIVRTPDGHDSAPEGENYKQATFIGNKAGKCRIVFLSHGQWSEADVENDLWVQVVDPIYVKTYYGDKGKDFIKEYLGGYEWIDWVRDKNGYIQNTSGKPYTLRVGDVISVRSNAAGSFEMQGDGSTYLRKVGEQGGYTLYEARAATPNNSPVEIQHKNGNTVNDRLYVKVMPTTNNGYTHCDMEIADDGKYTLTEFTENGKTEKVYKAYVTKINSDTILRGADGNEVNRMPVDAYRKLGNPGQTQYEMTSAYYVGRYGYLGDTSLLHLDEYKVYTEVDDNTTDPPSKKWVEWHPGDPKTGDLFFDTNTHYDHQFDPNQIKSVDFYVQITLYPDEEIVYEKKGETYTEKSRKSIESEDPQVIENTKVHFEGQPIIDAMNKCPLDNGLDFTYQPAGALVKLQANKQLTNVGVDAEQGQFSFELRSGSKTGEVVGTAQNDAQGKVTFPYLAFSEKDKGQTFTYYMSEVPDADNTNVKEYDQTVHEVKITIGQDMSVTVKYDNGDNHPTFSNTLRDYTLPNTGGGGVIPHLCIGIGLISTAGLLLVRKKRRKSD